MNAARRKKLQNAYECIDRLNDWLEKVREQLEEIKTEEQDAMDNLPESIKEGARGELMQEYIDTLDEVIYEIGELPLTDWVETLKDI